MTKLTTADVTVAFPTYAREEILVASVETVLAESSRFEVLVLDQTPRHTEPIEAALRALVDRGAIRWLRLPQPSITGSMNLALRETSRAVVLFLDDDIVPSPGLVAAHAAAYEDPAVWAVAGQVLQPGEQPVGRLPGYRTGGFRAFLDFPFNSTERTFVANGIGCNFSVRRQRALGVGGFDENFVGVAYRFETEFCRRLCRAGGRVLFEPTASVRHLKASRGGTRVVGDLRRSLSPRVSVGDYYFALREGRGVDALLYALGRPVREVATRYHLRQPWWIPAKLVGELGAMAMAIALARRGPRLGFPLGTR